MKVDFFDGEDGRTYAVLTTKQGKFFGDSKYNVQTEKLPPSYMVGSRIAEDRAWVQYYLYMLRQTETQKKGVLRTWNSIPADKKEVKHYVGGTLKAIQKEIDMYQANINFYKRDINDAIEARKLYIRSRSATKEEKERQKKALGEAMAALGKLNKDKKD